MKGRCLVPPRPREKREEIPLESWVAYIKLRNKKRPNAQHKLAMQQFENEVIRVYGFIAKAIALRFVKKKPQGLELSDLMNAGMMGLIEATRRYTPDGGAKFNTFATWRVRGSIIDQINSLDWTPRKIRENIKEVIKAIEQVSQKSPGSEPTVDELSAHLQGLTREQISETLTQINKTHFSYIDEEMIGLITAQHNESKYLIDDESEKIKTIMTLVLNIQEREIVELHYFANWTDREIRQKMGLGMKEYKSIKERALEKLKHNIY